MIKFPAGVQHVVLRGPVGALLIVLSGCAAVVSSNIESEFVGAVAVPDRFAADVATQILDQGGNAVDAAVAVALSLAVTYPEAGNIGGGGFMLVYADKQSYFLDYRETAPAAARADMYLDQDGNVIEGLSLYGHKAVGVPGTVAGLVEAHRRFGILPWKKVVAPAIKLAVDGFIVPEHLARRIAEHIKETNDGNFVDYFGHARAGQQFVQPELAGTLERIAAGGANGFYFGRTAALLAQEMQRGGGLITEQDLAAYKPRWREPLKTSWRQYQLVAAPPPSSGGFAVIQLLKMKDELAQEFLGLEHNSDQYIHLIAEMEKRVFADRAEYFGDPEFISVPVNQLLDENYIRSRARQVHPDRISAMAESAPGLESRHTTHFSIVDRWGNAVSNTYTINTWFGSSTVVSGAGFLLNNEMDDFSAKPGSPNFYGVVGEAANAIAPGKRMLSSMSPTLLLKNDQVHMVLGTPGGSTIFTSVFQTIINIEDFSMTPQQAVAATRFHHQLIPVDLITYSPTRPLPSATIVLLTQRGYSVLPHPWIFGDVQVLLNRQGEYQGGSDPRGRGVARTLH